MNIKVAVIGGGYWGKNLVRNFHGLGSLYAVCDSDQSKLASFKKDYPDIEIFKTTRELYDSKKADAVVIATPAEFHYKMVREALLKNKDVFVEKPLSLSVNEGIELNHIARKKGRILMVGHLLRYHPAVIKLKEMVESGELGRLYYVYSNRLNLGKIRQEENILWSFAPHDISVILSLTGQMPDEVTSFGGRYLQEKVADVTLSTLSFPSGIKAHIFVNWLHPYKEQKFIVVGSEKMAVFNDVGKDKLLLYPHKINWRGNIPIPDKKDAQIIEINDMEPLRQECSHFLECVKTRRSPVTDGDEGLRVLSVLDACQRSLESGGSPVRVGNNKNVKKYSVHATAIIDEPSEIGEGTSIWHFSHILKGSKIGKNCRVGQNVVIGPNAVIGNNVKIQNNVSVYEGVELEDNVFCGPSMVFTNVFNPRSEIPRMKELRKTLVKHGATIGANATIICGNTIGKFAFIGAGAVVTRDVPDYGLAMGNPAKHSGWICRCGEKLRLNRTRARCNLCGDEYKLRNKKLEAVISK
ncbi:MAG: Gfo/Idh/MocA family oxidoreductase [Nitrospirae bacterium]|nr:Gfo/Idh/MocA family oxidoreductase [Nitrospirota bacterium]